MARTSNSLTGMTGTLPVANGGSGATTFTAYSVITAGTTATGAFQNVSGVGTSGQVLTSNGAAALPTWQNAAGGAQKFKITIPGEQVLDASNYQGMYFYNDTGATITISNLAIIVGVAAAGAGAACAVNIYKSSGTAADGLNTNAVNLFTSAIDLTTTYASLTNAPNTATVESGRWITLRVTASAGATNKASDLQAIITYT